MKLKELKEVLDALPDEDMELDVAVFADHAQMVERAGCARAEWVSKDSERDLIHEDDLPYKDADEVERMFVIG